METEPKQIPSKISVLLDAASEGGASDLFLTENAVPLVKVDGQLGQLGSEVVDFATMSEFWSFCQADPRYDSDRDTSVVSGMGIRFRVNLHRHAGGIGAVLRVIRTSVPPMESLGLPTEMLRSWATRMSGIVFVTGPTGSGKSTTIASMLEWVNEHQARHIVSIEDPIEFIFEPRQCHFTQREVFTDTDSFHRGLRSGMRQAPDIIFLGEVRDAETASVVLEAAETGHLVVTTLHSTNVAETIDRLVHLFPPDVRESQLLLLSSQLIGVLCQRLLVGAEGGLQLVCEHFENSGLTRKLIREGNVPEILELMQRGDNPHNRLFLDSLVDACRSGRLRPDVATEAAPSASDFKRAMRGISS
ncbi:MAG: ATPase, T2SS/T4P/T4SS family [Verrucomicrobiota bacterium]